MFEPINSEIFLFEDISRPSPELKKAIFELIYDKRMALESSIKHLMIKEKDIMTWHTDPTLIPESTVAGEDSVIHPVLMYFDGNNDDKFEGYVVGYRVYYRNGTQYTGEPGSESEPVSEYWFDSPVENYANTYPPIRWCNIPAQDPS